MNRRIPSGEFDGSSIEGPISKIHELDQVIQALGVRTDLGLTARKFDESQPAGHRVYIGAYNQIQSGVEHTEALIALIQSSHGLTPRAPWTIMRAIYEAGFWATWLLEPGDGKCRRQRGLRVEVLSHVQRAAFFESLLKYDPQRLQESKAGDAPADASYRADAKALGLSWDQARQRPNVVSELEKLEFVRALEPDLRGPTVAFWRSLSGLQHGYPYALIVNSDLENETPIQGGRQGVVSVNDDAFASALLGSLLLLSQGMRLYIDRCTRP